MKNWILMLFFLSIILNVYQTGISFSRPPDYQIKIVKTSGVGGLTLDDFNIINRDLQVSKYPGCAVAPVDGGWLTLVSQGSQSEREVKEAFSFVENRIEKVLSGKLNK